MNVEQLKQAVLARISSGEATSYNELFGGGSFSDYSDHPRQRVPLGNGSYTTAAGKYQFLSPTWDDEKKRLGLPDFSPQSQDAAAWDLASRTYKSATGRDILDDAANSDVDWRALGSQWTSLAGSKSGGAPSADSASDSSSVDGSNSAPSVSAGDDASQSPMKNLQMLQSLAPHLQFTPIDYDPFKVLQSGAS